ncbi:hypothetical protein JG687_00005927 [Phytophthora cactorum]|uniref:RxLR effector protein n=1 Tax=Phytophthora cactorum TaxID=29920 RepID=A0A329SML8_9STRA|nr:hypothetical protein Pcac1_g6224 [Phytophthora cactorum]KAG2806761.1 hypothetical protein PC112_g17710 [Phytophthora cactorum]KAG2846288.1 hypothetical protein PC111_g1250 [Phytophthora cactorum]KAG2855329.1 hypothetical protein PC113_g12535 [Phytophthora cactorum]KAG2900739.1 hypothetical protein PC115_g16101 [Phytophthora cactorum]
MRATQFLLLVLLVSCSRIATAAVSVEINGVAAASHHGHVIEDHRYLRDCKITKSKMSDEERAVTPQFGQLYWGILAQLPTAIRNSPVGKLFAWLGRLLGKGIGKLYTAFARKRYYG